MQVFGSEDADGFYYGECNGRRGLVPSNIVALVEVDDAEAAMQLLHDSGQSMAADDSRSSSQTSSYVSHRQGSVIVLHPQPPDYRATRVSVLQLYIFHVLSF